MPFVPILFLYLEFLSFIHYTYVRDFQEVREFPQKLMRDGRFDILEKILEIEKQIVSLEEEKKKLLESA